MRDDSLKRAESDPSLTDCRDSLINVIRGADVSNAQRVFLDYEALIACIGISVSKTTLWRWEKAHKFPKRVSLNNQTIGWLASEILAWVEARCNER